MMLEIENLSEERTRPTVLHIEGSLTSLDLIGRLLRYMGYEVVTVGTGEEGIAWTIENHPDIILMDTNLPDIDARVVVNTLKNNQESKDIPLVALTYQNSNDIEDVLPAGCDGYIFKPIEVEVLIDEVGRLLKGKQ